MKRSQLFLGIGGCIGMVVLILDSKTALEGARQGIDLCIQSLIPSLFPFFILSGLLTSAFLGTDLPLLRPLGSLLGIPKGCESLLIPAFLGGYPAGANTIGQAVRQDSLGKDTAQKLLLFCNNAGPSFLFGILGPMFPQSWMLWALWGVHLFSAMLYGWCIRSKEIEGSKMCCTEFSLPVIVSDSVRTLGTVCGWVLVFRVAMAFLDRWFLWQVPDVLRVILIGGLELSNGCLQLQNISDVRLRFMVASGLLAFGGLCVTMQTASVSEKLPILPYFISKVLQCLLSLLLSGAIIYQKPSVLLIVPLFSLGLKKVVAIREGIVYNSTINSRRNPYAVSKEDRTRLYLLSPGYSVGGRDDSLHKEGTAHAG